ncbi:unnamed protein product [Mytilus coruscus]|uniref:Uncharacterized protein n=1 Tax=Mytilus coruscus TaxID=42192 RepID=A0A6J8BKE7_MYTCO|nr:unnamed protein product [Mytilus coruscus]
MPMPKEMLFPRANFPSLRTVVPRSSFFSFMDLQLVIQIADEVIIDEDEKVEDTSIVVDRSFNVPEPVLEESLQDESIGDITVDHNPTTEYHVVDFGSNRGKRNLVDTDGFSFTVKVKQNSKAAVYGVSTSAIVKTAMRTHADPTAPEASRPNPNYLVRT